MRRNRTARRRLAQIKAIKIIFLALVVALSIAAADVHLTASAQAVKEDYIVIEKVVEREVVVEVEKPVTIYGDEVDSWVGKYTDKYFTGSKRSEVRMILHCLLNRESKHGADSGHGDNGKAGGPLQFHQSTWEGYRKLMLKEGLIEEIGSRYNMEQAIHTTAWAISTGRALAWGPILRDSEGNNYASCQTPSWY